MFDGYYNFNNNHPASGLNQFYNFDDRGNQVDLNLLKMTVRHDASPIGFQVDVGFGRAFQIMHAPGPDPDAFRFLEQAYISVKPKGWKGFEADFGEFVTSAGSEVIESKDNWNYSRSYLFAFGPYYHFGIRTTMPIGQSLTVGLQLVNGWNAVVDNYGNNMQTVGLTSTVSRKKFTWSNNYYVGEQDSPTLTGVRNYYDTALLLTPTSKLSAYVNYDYGRQHAVTETAERSLHHWQGIAGALHWQVTQRFAVSPRLEYFDDATGFATGMAQKLHEFTITGEYRLFDGVLTRAEFRRDDSNVPYFDRGNETARSKSQTTATIALIAFFPSKK